MIRVNPSNSSCARKIYEVFQHHGLKLIHFDIKYRDGNDNQYTYAIDASSTASIEKNHAHPVFSLFSTSSETARNFNASEIKIAQQSLDDRQIIADIQNALTQDHVTLLSANITAKGSDGEPCSITFPFCNGSYCPEP